MRQLRYSVAASLDGYIAGPDGDFDWIVIDPEIDFAAMYAGFSGLVMGRRSYEVFVATGGAVGPALPTYVYSRTLPEGERDGVTFVADAVSHVRAPQAGIRWETPVAVGWRRALSAAVTGRARRRHRRRGHSDSAGRRNPAYCRLPARGWR